MAQSMSSGDPSDQEIHDALMGLFSNPAATRKHIPRLYSQLQRNAENPAAVRAAFVTSALSLAPKMAQAGEAFAGHFFRNLLPAIVREDKNRGLHETFIEKGLAALPPLARAVPWIADIVVEAVHGMAKDNEKMRLVFLAHGGKDLAVLAQDAPGTAALLSLHLMQVAKQHGHAARLGVQRAVFGALPGLMKADVMRAASVIKDLKHLSCTETLDGPFIAGVFDALPAMTAANPMATAGLLDSSLAFIRNCPEDRQDALKELFRTRAQQAKETVADPDVMASLEQDIDKATRKKPAPPAARVRETNKQGRPKTTAPRGPRKSAAEKEKALRSPFQDAAATETPAQKKAPDGSSPPPAAQAAFRDTARADLDKLNTERRQEQIAASQRMRARGIMF